MPNQLTQADLDILNRYAERGERAGYWTYLADRGDPYAKLALQVVLNNTFDGAVANRYAQDVARESGTLLTPERWEEVGRDLIRADYLERQNLVSQDQGEAALFLQVKQIKDSHAVAFGQSDLSLDAWTAWPPMKAAFDAGDLARAQEIWDKMIDGGVGNTVGVLINGTANSLLWAARVSFVGYQLRATSAGVDPVADPNFIRGNYYSPSDGSWYSIVAGINGSTIVTASKEDAARLDAERIQRIVISGQGIFDSLDARARQSEGSQSTLVATLTSILASGVAGAHLGVSGVAHVLGLGREPGSMSLVPNSSNPNFSDVLTEFPDGTRFTQFSSGGTDVDGLTQVVLSGRYGDQKWEIPAGNGSTVVVYRDSQTGASRQEVWSGESGNSALLQSTNIEWTGDGIAVDTYEGDRLESTRKVALNDRSEFIFKDFDGDHMLQRTTVKAPDGTSVETVQNDPADINNVTTTRRDAAGNITSIEEQAAENGRLVNRIYDANRQWRGTQVIKQLADGTSVRDTAYPDGSSVQEVMAADGKTVLSRTGTAPVLQQFGVAIQDVNNLVNAIRGGQPLPILNSGLQLLNHQANPVANGQQIINDTPLFTTTAVVNGILSLYNLHRAFDDGSDLERVYATGNALVAVNDAVNAVFNAAGGTVGGAASTVLSGVSNTVGAALPYIGAAISIKNGDYTGAAVAIASALNVPYIGWVYAAYLLISSIGDEPPEAWGTAWVRFADAGDPTGIRVDVVGDSFGPDRVRLLMEGADGSGGLIGYLNNVIGQSRQYLPDTPLGIIPQRLPRITWREARQGDPGYAMVDIDPLTGEERYPGLRYNDNFTPYNADATDPAQRLTVLERMIDSALQRGAVAPMWEVQTARMQQDVGDPNAGLTEEERAGKRGQSAAADANGKRLPGEFRPIVLDLDGDNVINIVSDADSQVGLDWDDTGFVAQTGWIGGGEGFLTLDRNLNGQVDSGRELFSNGLVSNDARGVRSLNWVDANADGVIDSRDPVFAALRVWQDANQDGVQNEGETRSLGELGISSLDYEMGRFVRNGQNYAMQSSRIEASNEGTRVNVVKGGVQVYHSDGRSALFVIAAQDAGGGTGAGTNFVTRDDSIVSYEDGMSPDLPNAHDPKANQPISISFALLTANDKHFEDPLTTFSITAVDKATHGVVSIDAAQGVINFTPEHNYFGPASFEYTVSASDGQTRTAQVFIDLQSVIDAPAVSVSIPNRAVYGYGSLVYSRVMGNGDQDRWTEYTYVHDQGAPSYEPLLTVGGRFLDARRSGGDVDSVEIFESGPVVDTGISKAFFDQAWGAIKNSVQSGVDIPTPTFIDMVGIDGRTYRIQPDSETFEHGAIIAEEAGNDGQIIVESPDGATQMRFEIVSKPLYGEAKIDETTGAFTYTGLRQFEDTSLGLPPFHNILTDHHSRAEGLAPNYDSFIVRVIDLRDPSGNTFTNQTVTVPHYGPLPLPDVASGGGKPIAIDLDGDGFEFVGVDDSNVFLTVNGEGWRRRTAWVGADDGILVYDENRNGRVDSTDEVSFTRFLEGAQTDLEGLRAFDTNGDGVFSSADSKWSDFSVWRDSNGDGVVDAGEMQLLDELGLESIGLTSDGKFQVINGQTVHGTGVATRKDGGTWSIADVTLQYRNVTEVTNADGSAAVADVATFSEGQKFAGTDGADLVFGTSGSDEFVMGAGNDVVTDDGGNDAVQTEAGDDLVFTGTDNDYVDAGGGNDTVFAGAGNDLAVGGDGDDALMLEAGNDIAFGSDGNDFISGGSGNDLLSGDAGSDRLFGEGGWDQLIGQDGDDELWGMDGNDALDGGLGNDLLAGGEGADTMEGGGGDDTYEVDSAQDHVIEAASAGNDTVRASIDYSLSSAVENLTLTGDAALDGIGSDDANVLYGNTASNVLEGRAGDDMLDGGAGADTLVGGSGNDEYVVDNVDDRVVELVGEGMDEVQTRVSLTLATNVENLKLLGLAAINGKGNELDNVLVGNGASNILDGGAGADEMKGGDGNDRYIVDNFEDRVVEADAEGFDRVTTVGLADYTLADGVEELALGEGALGGRGNAMSNRIDGNALDNRVDGLDGDDTIDGGLGADTLMGGVGSDQLLGGAGNDWLDGGLGTDTMTGGIGDDRYAVDETADKVVELVGEGRDFVEASVNYALQNNVEDLTLRGSATEGRGNGQGNRIAGNELANHLDGLAGDDVLHGLEGEDVLLGNEGADILDGGNGADTLLGGQGDDVYVTDNAADSVIEAVDDGFDTVFSTVSLTLGDNLENLVLTGASALEGRGNSLSNVLVGNGEINLLSAGAGDDMLAGGQGDDTLEGGAGDDLYLYYQGEGRDFISDAAGTDTLRFGIGMTLESVAARKIQASGKSRVFISILDRDGQETSQGVEFDLDSLGNGPIEKFQFVDGTIVSLSKLLIGSWGTRTYGTFIGSRNDENIAGMTGNDVFYGRSGNDRLEGYVGNDKLFGEGGNDQLHGEDGDDELWGGAGDDMLRGYTGNDLLVGGNGKDNLWGDEGGDRLDGGAGNDTLEGGAGDDELYGADGDDTLRGNAGVNLLVGGAGNDALMVASDTGVFVSGLGDDRIWGGNASDFIDAGFGGDTLAAGSGADFIVGGGGDDNVNAGTGNDVIAFNRGDGADHVATSDAWHDTVSLGGGIRYSDLSISRSGSDLVLSLGGTDRITFGNWYSDATRRSVSLLQVITGAAGGDFDATSSSEMFNQRVVTFDFKKLVERFDAWWVKNPSIGKWALSPELDVARLAASNTEAIGGDFAWRYATTGSYGDLGWRDAGARMASVDGATLQSFSSSMTEVDPWIALQAGLSLIGDQTVGLPSPIAPLPAPSQDALVFAAIGGGGQMPSWRNERSTSALAV